MMRYWPLCGILLSLSSPAWGADLSRFFSDVHTLSGRFSQVVRNRRGSIIMHGTGHLWLRRPGHFRWDYQRPYKEEIVGRGAAVWLYDPGLAQATRYSLSHALGRTPALLLAGRGHLTHLFQVQNLPASDHLTWLKLTPRGTGQGFRWIQIGYHGLHISRILLRDAMGQTTAITLHDVKLNGVLPASTFRFRPPPHTAIVRE